MSLIPSSTITGTGTEIVAKDWDATPLGSIGQWPMPLRSTVALMLACPTPMFLAWGPELRCFYNDAYRPILGLGKNSEGLTYAVDLKALYPT